MYHLIAKALLTPHTITFSVTCAVCAGPPEACELAYYETTCHPPDHYCINHITTKETGQRLVERRYE